jgi:hypothetical protein
MHIDTHTLTMPVDKKTRAAVSARICIRDSTYIVITVYILYAFRKYTKDPELSLNVRCGRPAKQA